MITKKNSSNGKSDATKLAVPMVGEAIQSGINFATCPDEIARRAYFSYVNEGAPEGRAVQHWLDAETRLLNERELTRTHTFPHHT